MTAHSVRLLTESSSHPEILASKSPFAIPEWMNIQVSADHPHSDSSRTDGGLQKLGGVLQSSERRGRVRLAELIESGRSELWLRSLEVLLLEGRVVADVSRDKRVAADNHALRKSSRLSDQLTRWHKIFNRNRSAYLVEVSRRPQVLPVDLFLLQQLFRSIGDDCNVHGYASVARVYTHKTSLHGLTSTIDHRNSQKVTTHKVVEPISTVFRQYRWSSTHPGSSELMMTVPATPSVSASTCLRQLNVSWAEEQFTASAKEL